MVKLSDVETHKVFYDKLAFFYLEMPKFKKKLSEPGTHFEKWLYLILYFGRSHAHQSWGRALSLAPPASHLIPPRFDHP